MKKNQNAPRPSERPPVRGGKCQMVLVVVVVVSHIQRIGCQPEKTSLHGGQSRSWSAAVYNIFRIRTHLAFWQMILVQMYNIFRLLLRVPDYSIVKSRMEENKNM